jgi:tRNA(fMet)-specific endonuclease VapC
VAARAADYLREHGHLTTSVLTVMEIVKGYQRVMRPAALADALAALRVFEIAGFDEEAAVLAGKIHGDLERTGQPLGRVDEMIASVALRLELTLVTGNTAHYERIRSLGYGLRLEDWRQA